MVKLEGSMCKTSIDISGEKELVSAKYDPGKIILHQTREMSL